MKLPVGTPRERRARIDYRARFDLEFNIQATTVLAELMAVLDTEDGRSYHYVLQTRLGMLRIGLYGSWVALRFDDVAKAAQELGLHTHFNQYSGKWNLVWSDDLSLSARLDALRARLESVRK